MRKRTMQELYEELDWMEAGKRGAPPLHMRPEATLRRELRGAQNAVASLEKAGLTVFAQMALRTVAERKRALGETLTANERRALEQERPMERAQIGGFVRVR